MGGAEKKKAAAKDAGEEKGKENDEAMPDPAEEGGVNNDEYYINKLFQTIDKDTTLSQILKTLVDSKRNIDATSNNPQSSRSHVISTIYFPDKKCSLFIGDFAGVENEFDISI